MSISANIIHFVKREQLLNCREKLDHNITMIQEVFSSGIERGRTKRVATSILIVSFSPGVLHQRPIQAVHFLAESLDFSTLCPNQTHLASCWPCAKLQRMLLHQSRPVLNHSTTVQVYSSAPSSSSLMTLVWSGLGA